MTTRKMGRPAQPPAAPLGVAIRAIQEHHGLTAVALAARLGVAQSTVIAWTHGRRIPRAAELAALAELAPDGGAALLTALRDANTPRPHDAGRGV